MRLALALVLFALAACAGEPDRPPPAEGPPADLVPPPDTLPGDDPLAEAEDAEDPEDAEVLTPPPDRSPEGARGSCDVRTVHGYCYAFTGTGWTGEAAERECSGTDEGVFRASTCPSGRQIGRCTYRPGGDAAREIVYVYYAPYDPRLAQLSCPGTYTAL